jgi:hypothetical protein
MVRFPEYTLPTIKPHEKTLFPVPFDEYLKQTNRVETFIVTHRECYGYNVIDMLARGIRVVAPEGFLHPTLTNRFKIPVFWNAEELQKIVRSPLKPYWNLFINRCTDYSQMASIILSTLKSLV